jgi:hypothetical protein
MGEDRNWRVALVPNTLYLAAKIRWESLSAIQQTGIEPIVDRLADLDFLEVGMLGIQQKIHLTRG